MADIRIYQRERQTEDPADYQKKIRRHRLGMIARILLVVLLLAGAGIIWLVRLRERTYSSADYTSVAQEPVAPGIKEVRLSDTVLTYSKDGAHCTDARGNVIWNQTFEMQDILLDTCENVAVLAEYNGRNVYVVSSQGILGTFTTSLLIRRVAVAANGNVAVIMADTDRIYHNVYSVNGTELFVGEATMERSGYPAALALSPDGTLLEMAYIYLDAGIQKSNVAFYNLGDVGDNVSDRLVSIYIYEDQLIPCTAFLRNDTAFALGDSKFLFFKGSQKPVLLKEYEFTEEIRSVFYNENYVGLVFYSDKQEARYRMDVYTAGGEQAGSFYFNMEYTDLFFEKDSFVLYNESECVIMTMNGKERYKGAFPKAVRRIVPQKSSTRYLLVMEGELQMMSLK